MRFLFARLPKVAIAIAALCAIGFGGLAAHLMINRAEQRICANDPKALAKYRGEYARDKFFYSFIKDKSVNAGLMAHHGDGPVAVTVSTNGILLSYGWHEADNAQCVSLRGEEVRIADSPNIYVHIGQPGVNGDFAAPYFEKLFAGCFRDDLSKEWCFGANSINIEGVRHTALLHLDTMELPDANALTVDGNEVLFWFFRATADGGWRVFQGGSLLDGSPPVDWEKPWRVLKPATTTVR